MIRRPPRSTLDRSSAASDVYKRQAYISMNDERFYYSNDNEPGGELNIYKDNKETPIVTCKGADEFKKDKKLSDISHPGLLMAVCWYMFLPAMKEKMTELVPA